MQSLLLFFRIRGHSKGISPARLYFWGLACTVSILVSEERLKVCPWAQFAQLPRLEQGQGGSCLYHIMLLIEWAYSCSGTENAHHTCTGTCADNLIKGQGSLTWVQPLGNGSVLLPDLCSVSLFSAALCRMVPHWWKSIWQGFLRFVLVRVVSLTQVMLYSLFQYWSV